MVHKWIGALLVISTSGGFGILLAWEQLREERMLAQLSDVLGYMDSQLAYRMTPLPDLCREGAALTPGPLGQVFAHLSQSLELTISPDVSGCMQSALFAVASLPPVTAELLQSLGNTLGRFDLSGQRKGLLHLQGECRRKLQHLRKNRSERLRSIRTLGFCAGAALTILLI